MKWDAVIHLDEGTIGILVPEGKPTSMAAAWAATLAPVDLVLGCGIRFICGIRLICGIRFVSSGRRSETVIRLEEGTIGTISILVPEGKPTSMAAEWAATLAPVDLVLGCGIRFICGIRLICGIRFVSSGRRSLVDTVIRLEEGTIGTIGILVPEGKPTSMAAAWAATLAPVDLVLGCGIRFICGIRLICGIRFVSSGRRSLVDTVIPSRGGNYRNYRHSCARREANVDGGGMGGDAGACRPCTWLWYQVHLWYQAHLWYQVRQ